MSSSVHFVIFRPAHAISISSPTSTQRYHGADTELFDVYCIVSEAIRLRSDAGFLEEFPHSAYAEFLRYIDQLYGGAPSRFARRRLLLVNEEIYDPLDSITSRSYSKDTKVLHVVDNTVSRMTYDHFCDSLNHRLTQRANYQEIQKQYIADVVPLGSFVTRMKKILERKNHFCLDAELPAIIAFLENLPYVSRCFCAVLVGGSLEGFPYSVKIKLY